MRMGSTLLALIVSGLFASAGMAQSSTDPLAIPPAKTGMKPAPAAATNAKKPATKGRTKKSTTGRSARLMQAQRAAQARFHAVIPPQQFPQGFNGDPLGLAAGSPGLMVYGSPPITGTFPYGGGFAIGGTGGGVFNVPGIGTVAATGTQVTPTANGGLVGVSDTHLIHGSDRDGADPTPVNNPGITGSRSERVAAGTYTPGYGVPLRKGESVYRGNYIPGRGVIGPSTDRVAGGTYVPGYGVGSFDPRERNGRADQVAGGTYMPGFGVQGGGAASGFSGGGLPSYYSGAGLAGNNYSVGLPGYYGTTGTATNFGGTGLPGYYGTTGISPSYSGAGVVPGFGAGVGATSSFGAGIPGYYGTTGTATTFGGTGGATGFGSTIPSAYGAGSVHPGTHR